MNVTTKLFVAILLLTGCVMTFLVANFLLRALA